MPWVSGDMRPVLGFEALQGAVEGVVPSLGRFHPLHLPAHGRPRGLHGPVLCSALYLFTLSWPCPGSLLGVCTLNEHVEKRRKHKTNRRKAGRLTMHVCLRDAVHVWPWTTKGLPGACDPLGSLAWKWEKAAVLAGVEATQTHVTSPLKWLNQCVCQA